MLPCLVFVVLHIVLKTHPNVVNGIANRLQRHLKIGQLTVDFSRNPIGGTFDHVHQSMLDSRRLIFGDLSLVFGTKIKPDQDRKNAEGDAGNRPAPTATRSPTLLQKAHGVVKCGVVALRPHGIRPIVLAPGESQL